VINFVASGDRKKRDASAGGELRSYSPCGISDINQLQTIMTTNGGELNWMDAGGRKREPETKKSEATSYVRRFKQCVARIRGVVEENVANKQHYRRHR